jgi:L-cysteine:1D-myo-inositol 2-amino-2-deoxy-alpha-D-glucopyranoside ligase
MAIRLVLLAQHYRSDWDYTPELLTSAQGRLERWREALSVNTAPSADDTVAAIRSALADDLDAPRALAAVDAWTDRTLSVGGDEASAPGVLGRALDALLGIRV